MATTGAVIVFSTFSGASAGRRRSFDSAERRNANRAGAAFALVGAHFSTSYSSRRVSSLTGRGSHFIKVRASKNRPFNADSSTRSLIEYLQPRLVHAASAPRTTHHAPAPST